MAGGPPLLSDVLRALAETAPLDDAAKRLGISPGDLRDYLINHANATLWRKPAAAESRAEKAGQNELPPIHSALPGRSESASVVEGRTGRAQSTGPSTAGAKEPAPYAQDEWDGRRAIYSGPPTELKTVEALERAHTLEVFCDGAARNNPGPAGAGAVVRTTDGKIIARLGKFLGVQTNNVAEYEGLILGVTKAAELGAREVHVYADSLLIISQLRGEWKVKHPGLKPLYDRAKLLLKKFDRVKLQHIPREQNSEADEMSNRAIDERM